MNAFFARLFAPTYTQEITLASGQIIEMKSHEPFTLDIVANHLRPAVPVKHSGKFARPLPWILVSLLVVALAVSGYFLRDQHQQIVDLQNEVSQQQEIAQYWEDVHDNLSVDYGNLESSYDDLYYEHDQCQQQRTDLRSQNDSYYELLVNTHNRLAEVRDSVGTADDRAYEVYNNSTYGVPPTTDELDIVRSYIRDAWNDVDPLVDDLYNFLNP